MKCPHCSFENPTDAKFCENCGKPLERACPNCGKANSPTAKFCKNCGYTLAGEPAPERKAKSEESAGGERKFVTVLFTDVVGSTTMGEQLDPEEITDLMNGAFAFMNVSVTEFGGTVARLMGDAILAFFGAPVAHEDDAERAVRAGLAILDAANAYAATVRKKYGFDFQVRVGINTGLAVLDRVGDSIKTEYTAMGDTTNLAARMQSAAEPNTTLISEYTYRYVAQLFDFEDRGEIVVKGKSEPVHVYRVRGDKQDASRVRGIEGLDSPLVGREKEMHALERARDELLHGRGQIVSVMGEAGLGKSRLVAELSKMVAPSPALKASSGQRADEDSDSTSPSSVLWLEGRSLSYQTASPYAPFIDLFNHYFQLQDSETDLEKYDKIKVRVAELLPGRVDTLAPFMATLLGIELLDEDLERIKFLPPPELREHIFRATRDLLERMAGMQPTILVFEDVHWADSNSLDLLEYLLPLVEHAMVLFLMLMRPHREDAAWRVHEFGAREYGQRYTVLQLEALNDAQARELVANLLTVEDLPESVRALILAKADGNPFFVEEVIRSLLDQKLVVRENLHWHATREIVDIQVPNTLAALVSARLDRLDDPSKHAAQTAAVIGREFARDVLAEMSDEPQALDRALTMLQRRELIREKGRLPRTVYNFKHIVTQETAYATLLLSKRRDLHKRVAEYLERVEPEQVNEIARHFVQAKENERALPYLIGAGERAARAFSMPEALAYYVRAVEIAKTTDNTTLGRRAFEGLGRARELANDIPGAVKTYEEMEDFGKQHEDVPLQVSALNKLSAFLAIRLGQFPEAETRLAGAEQLAREFHDRAGLNEMFIVRCYVCATTADFDNAFKYLNESLESGRELNIQEQVAFSLTHIANTQVWTAHFDDAEKTIQEARRLMEEIGDSLHLAELLAYAYPAVYFHKGDLDTSRRVALEGTRLAARLGAVFWESLAALSLGRVMQARGEYEDAIAAYQRSVRTARTSKAYGMPAIGLAPLAQLYTEISPLCFPQAEELLAQAAELLSDPARVLNSAQALTDAGLAEVALGRPDQAEEFFQTAMASPTTNWLLERPRSLIGLASIALARGRCDDAQKWVDEATEDVHTRGMKNEYPRVAYADAQVAVARGDLSHALEQFALAENLALEMQMRPLILDAGLGAARVLDSLGRGEQADEKRRQAKTVIDEMANLFDDGKLRDAFVEHANERLG